LQENYPYGKWGISDFEDGYIFAMVRAFSAVIDRPGLPYLWRATLSFLKEIPSRLSDSDCDLFAALFFIRILSMRLNQVRKNRVVPGPRWKALPSEGKKPLRVLFHTNLRNLPEDIAKKMSTYFPTQDDNSLYNLLYYLAALEKSLNNKAKERKDYYMVNKKKLYMKEYIWPAVVLSIQEGAKEGKRWYTYLQNILPTLKAEGSDKSVVTRVEYWLIYLASSKPHQLLRSKRCPTFLRFTQTDRLLRNSKGETITYEEYEQIFSKQNWCCNNYFEQDVVTRDLLVEGLVKSLQPNQ